MEEKKPESDPEETIFEEADFSLEGYDKHIRNARNMLFVIAALQLLPLLFLGPLPVQTKLLVAVVSILVSTIFFVLALWTKQRPYAALLAASIVYIALVAINGFLNPSTLLQGAVLKVIIIVLLILGIRNAREAQRMKDTFGKK